MLFFDNRRICCIENCGKKFHSTNYCSTHYARFVKHGDPLYFVAPLTDDERKKRRTIAKKKYKKTEKGKQSNERYYFGTGFETKKRSVIRRRKRIKESTPPWQCKKQINSFYRRKPKGFHVDHIHPVVGLDKYGNEISRGLNVIWNLQYLKPDENAKKGSRVI